MGAIFGMRTEDAWVVPQAAARRMHARRGEEVAAMPRRGDEERDAIRHEFDHWVNMSPKELERWLQTDESKSVGWRRDGGESIGHTSGRKIVRIRRTKKADLTAADVAHMRKVVGYIKRHCAEGLGDQDRKSSRWRYSLMNWGHDPLKA